MCLLGGWRFIIACCPFVILFNYVWSYLVCREVEPEFREKSAMERETREQVHGPHYAGRRGQSSPTSSRQPFKHFWTVGLRLKMGLDKTSHGKSNIKAGQGLDAVLLYWQLCAVCFHYRATSGIHSSVLTFTRMLGNYSFTYVHNSVKRENHAFFILGIPHVRLRYSRHSRTLFYCALLYCTRRYGILPTAGLWEACIEHACQCRFSDSTCSLVALVTVW